MQVIFQNTVNTSVFEPPFKNTVKYSILHMWCCKSRANSGVLATLAFFRVAKTSQIPMFRLYFGVAREGKHRK